MWRPKGFCGSARPVGRLTNTCKTACTKADYVTAHVSSCDELSKGFKCKCTSLRIRLCVRGARLLKGSFLSRGVWQSYRIRTDGANLIDNYVLPEAHLFIQLLLIN